MAAIRKNAQPGEFQSRVKQANEKPRRESFPHPEHPLHRRMGLVGADR